MKNVYYERLDEGLYYVLQTDRHKSIKNKKIVIAAYLYYEESLQYHIDILKRLPEYISVRLITSDKIIYGKLSDEAMARQNWEAVLKENRGRDISALLVSCKELFYKYDLLCFLHDKKEKITGDSEDIRIWCRTMWENLVYSEGYISRIADLLESSEVGLALPAIGLGKRIAIDQRGVWGRKNYENVCELLDRMDINVPVDKWVPPVSFGTMFWCRTKAMKKLVDIGWRDTDFPQEPLPDDNEINHAVERILPYVVQDAGAKTATVMTDIFSGKYIASLNHCLRNTLDITEYMAGVYYPDDVCRFQSRIRQLGDFIKECDKLYIYGTGLRGRWTLNILTAYFGIVPEGFINMKLPIETYLGHKTYSLNDITDKEAGIVVSTAGDTYIAETAQLLEKEGHRNVFLLYKR